MPQPNRNFRGRTARAKVAVAPRSRLSTLVRLAALSLLVGLMLLSLDFSVPDGSFESLELWLSRILNTLLRTAEFTAWCLGVGAAIVVPLWLLQRYRLQRSTSLPKLVASAPVIPPTATPVQATPASSADAPQSVATTPTTAAAPPVTPPAVPAMAEAKT